TEQNQPIANAIHDATQVVMATTKNTKLTIRAYQKATQKGDQQNSVRSVQRMTLPQGRSAAWVAEEYLRWLPTFLKPFLRVRVTTTNHIHFVVPLINLI